MTSSKESISAAEVIHRCHASIATIAKSEHSAPQVTVDRCDESN